MANSTAPCAAMAVPIRTAELLRFAPRDGRCLELAPFHRPALKKSDFRVDYVDYATTEELRARLPDGIPAADLCEVDVIWPPGRSLKECLGPRGPYDFAIASHVLEHVPNPLQWLVEVCDVLRTGARLQIALPTNDGSFDVLRRTTPFSEMLQNWATGVTHPTPGQLFDFISLNVAIPPGDSATPHVGTLPALMHTEENALSIALDAYHQQRYVDAHCSVFTPESFREVFGQASRLGILNVEIEPPVLGWREFFVCLVKRGEPSLRYHHVNGQSFDARVARQKRRMGLLASRILRRLRR